MATSFQFKPGFEQYPANWLTVKGIELFLDWAGKRLPSEAEWEYAARGGNQSNGYTYGGTNDARAAGWFLFGDINMDNPMTGNNFGDPSKNNKGTNIVGLKAANELGIYDLSGNVKELCSDYYKEDQYLYTEYYNPLGPVTGTSRSARGGAYESLNSEIMTRARGLADTGLTGIRAAGNHTGSLTVMLHGIVRDEYGHAMKDISLSDGRSAAVTTQSGRYQFRVGKDRSVIITPTHPRYTFSPSSITLESPEEVITNLNFTAYLKREVNISGIVTNENGVRLNRVRIKGLSDEVYTDGSGRFSAYVPQDSVYTLSAEILGYLPMGEHIVEVGQSDIADINFILEYVGVATLRGKVTKQVNGNPINNVLISGLDQEVYSFGQGSYFTQLTIGWSGVIKPMRTTFSSLFSPAMVEIDSLEGDMEINFEEVHANEAFYSGKVVDVNGNPVEGVKILGFDNKKAATSKTGDFGLQMARRWSGRITPQLEGYTFSPPYHDAYVAHFWENPPPSEPNFVASPIGDHTISGTVTDENGHPVQGVDVQGFGEPVLTDLNGNYKVWVTSNSSYTIQPELTGYNFSPLEFEASNIGANIVQDFEAIRSVGTGFTLKFIIQNDANRIANATITFNGESYITDNNGTVLINNVEAGTYHYSVTAQGYEDATGTISITDGGSNETIVMTALPPPVYAVTFTVNNGTNAIHNARIYFNGSDFFTDTNGEVTVMDIETGTYHYSVTAQGYEDATGTITITDGDSNETIVMTALEMPVYTITFKVTDGIHTIQNARVNIDGSVYVTDANGEATVMNAEAGTYHYSVTAQGYEDASGTVTVTNSDRNETILMTALPPPVYTVIFEVTNGMDAIKNANISFNDAEYITDATGVAEIKDLEAGMYSYAISAEGYEDANGTIMITGTDVIRTVTLSITTGVEEHFSGEIRCYPNPAYGKVTLSVSGYAFKEGYLSVINPLGQSETFPLTAGTNDYILNDRSSQFFSKAGIYIIQVYMDSKLTDVKKLVLGKGSPE